MPTAAGQPQVPQLLQLGVPSEYQGCCGANHLPQAVSTSFSAFHHGSVAAREHYGADGACLQPLPDSARGLVVGSSFLLFMGSKPFNFMCECQPTS